MSMVTTSMCADSAEINFLTDFIIFGFELIFIYKKTMGQVPLGPLLGKQFKGNRPQIIVDTSIII